MRRAHPSWKLRDTYLSQAQTLRCVFHHRVEFVFFFLCGFCFLSRHFSIMMRLVCEAILVFVSRVAFRCHRRRRRRPRIICYRVRMALMPRSGGWRALWKMCDRNVNDNKRHAADETNEVQTFARAGTSHSKWHANTVDDFVACSSRVLCGIRAPHAIFTRFCRVECGISIRWTVFLHAKDEKKNRR